MPNYDPERNTFIGKRYLRWEEDILMKLRKYLLNISAKAMGTTRAEIEPFLEYLFNSGNLTPTALYVDEDDEYSKWMVTLLINNNLYKKNNTGINDAIGTYWYGASKGNDKDVKRQRVKELSAKFIKKRTAGMSDEEYYKFSYDLVTELPDFSASINMIERCVDLDDDVLYKKNLLKWAGPGKKGWKDFKDALLPNRTNKNELKSHDNDLTVIDMTGPAFFAYLDDAENVIRITEKFPINDKAVDESHDKLTGTIKECRRRVALKPIPLKDIKEHFSEIDFDEEMITLARIGEDYDTEGKFLYWHVIEDVAGIVADKLEISRKEQILNDGITGLQAIQKKLYEPAEKAEEKAPNISYSPETPARTTVSLKGRTRNLKKLALYRGGDLTQDQLTELEENAVFVADSEFWMDEFSRNYILYSLVKDLRKSGRKFAINVDTGSELRQIAENHNNEYSTEYARKAKTSYEALRWTHKNGFSAYINGKGKVTTSRKSILNMCRENPDVLFCVLTGSQDFCERIKEEGLSNAIPVYRFKYPGTPDSYKEGFNMRIRPKYINLLERAIKASGEDEEKKEVTPSDKPVITKTNKPAEPATAPLSEAAEASPKVSESKPEESQKKKKKAVKEISKVLVKIPNAPGFTAPSIPKEGDELHTQIDEPITLSEEIAHGGEGKIFNIASKEKSVAKIYYPKDLSTEKEEKLKLMLKDKLNIPQVCWPTDLLYNENDQFVGFVMKKVSGQTPLSASVMQLAKPKVVEKLMMGWDRLSLVNLCISICDIFIRLHNDGILMGDVNPENILVDVKSFAKPNITFVDCDSYQVGGFPCPVGKPVFTSPKMYERNGAKKASDLRYAEFLRTIEDENYAIASLLFHIIMLGQAPFTAKNQGGDIYEAIRGYKFAYRGGDVSGKDTPDGPYYLIWNNTPKYIRDLFTEVFREGKDVKTTVFKSAFESYRGELKKGRFTKELTPDLYPDYSKEGDKESIFTYFECERCHKRRNISNYKYQRQEEYNDPHICPKCEYEKKVQMHIPETVRCPNCGRNYRGNAWTAWLQSIGKGSNNELSCPNCMAESSVRCDGCGKTITVRKKDTDKYDHIYCSDCKETVTGTCSSCGKTFTLLKGRMLESRKKGWVLRCSDCLSQETVTCEHCGTRFNSPKWKVVENRKKGRDNYCNDCLSKVDVTCWYCGNTYEETKFIAEDKEEKGIRFKCPDCRERGRR